MEHFKVDVTYTVYVEVADGTDTADVEQIAIEYLDDEFAHGRAVTVNPSVGEPDYFTFRLNGWATDTLAAVREP